MARKKINRRLRAMTRALKQTVPLPGLDDRVKLARSVPGWGGRRGLVVGIDHAFSGTTYKVRLDKTDWTIVNVMASEVMREDTLGREPTPLDTGSIWDVQASCFAAPASAHAVDELIARLV